MAKQTFTTGQVLTAAQMTDLQQTAMTGGAASTKTVSYVLVAADAGTRVAMNAAGSTTITVNTALFSAGDTVSIQNIGAGVCTVTAGTATVNTSGSLVLAQYQGGILYFTSSSTAIFFQFAVPGASGSTFAGCSLYLGSAISTSNDTYTTMTFNSENFDTDAYHSTSTNTSRITIPAGKGGKYLFYGNIGFTGNANGVRTATILKNGTIYLFFNTKEPGATYEGSAEITLIVNAVATDYFELLVRQDSGGNLNTSSGTDLSVFSCAYLGA